MTYIGRIRANTARFTDERVRLAGEAIAGSLAVKMLGEPFCNVFAIAPSHMNLWCTTAEPTVAGCAHHVLASCEGVVCFAPYFYRCASACTRLPGTWLSCVSKEVVSHACRHAPVHVIAVSSALCTYL